MKPVSLNVLSGIAYHEINNYPLAFGKSCTRLFTSTEAFPWCRLDLWQRLASENEEMSSTFAMTCLKACSSREKELDLNPTDPQRARPHLARLDHPFTYLPTGKLHEVAVHSTYRVCLAPPDPSTMQSQPKPMRARKPDPEEGPDTTPTHVVGSHRVRSLGEKADGIYTDVVSKEDLGTTDLNQEPYSAKNHVESSQTASSNNHWNIHDNRLVFSRSVYSFDIQEDVAPGTMVGLVTASAPNQGVDDKVYAIQEDDGNGLFVINPATGNFTLTRPLDFESAKYYILTVKATNTDGQFSVMRAYFNVLDINDNPPVFNPDFYSINIMENVPIGTSVLTLNVTDADEGLNAALIFKIISGDRNGQFMVDRNAVLRVQQTLDLEHQSVYTLIVQATDQAQCDSARFTSTAWITVKLNDVNDNTPEFRTVNTVYLPEDTSIGTVIMTVNAMDLDSGLNGHVEYSLQQFTGNKFSINVTSGELSVIGNLDRELVEWVTIDVIALDKGQPSLSSSISITAIITDVNDNSPVFTQSIYTVTVDENIPRGSDLLVVSATDPDEDKNGQVRYTISSKDFYIDSVTGLISVFGNLDREQIPVCSFVVFALDGGRSPRSGTATVNVILRDVNDFAPIIQPMKMTLHFLENINAVPQIMYQVLGRDDDLGSNSKLSYKIIRGNEDGKFSISANGGLSLVQSLDREFQEEYMLLVTAADAGVPPLTGSGTIKIIVDDLNDNTPAFDQSLYTVTVSEAAPVGVTVLTIHAFDPDAGENGKISYSMECGTSPFSIDPISGEIITTSALDREVQASYTLIILANDSSYIQPSSSSASVFIIIGDVNDEPPQFLNDPYVANVPAILNEGSIVYAVTAKDGDAGMNADLRFSLSGPNANKFVIDPLRGVIFAQHVLKGPMDITVNVNVTDGGKDPKMDSTTITVRFQSTNDFPQLFVDKNVHVYPEDQAVNTVISKVRALGKEKGEARPILFYLAAGNLEDVFQVNQLTGELIIKNALDFEIIKHYQLWIEARDSSSPPFSSYARIDINVTDVNDNFPEFRQSVYRCEIYENVPASKICNVSAADLDSGLNGFLEYSIFDGNANNVFEIDSYTGAIRTARMLDREQMALYTLTVEAKDKGSNSKTGTTTVIISVLDKNDNAPRFSQIFLAHVVENAPVGFTLVRITATDEDIGVNAITTYSISDQTASLPFGVKQSTGDLIVTRPLDREATDWYILRVHANDSAWDVNTDVTIFVIDTNDNSPQFTEPFYSLTIPEPKEKEIFVLQVSATDPDLESNGNIFYFLQSPNEFFRVNATTGEIFTKQFISFKNSDNSSTDQNKIKFSVIASDLGEQPNLSETTVAVTIVARNDYSPIFLPHRQLTPVPVNLAFGTKVAKLTAVDEDLYSNGKVQYYITGNNGSFLFSIERDSGWIFVAKSLASSLNKLFTVSVTATDEGTPPLSSNTIANFVITEENRFTPQFSTLQVGFSIPEDQSSGSVIGSLSASDTDQGINGHIMYSIVAGNNGGYFTIGNTTGLLTLVRSLDFEMDSVYSLQIYGQDGGWISKTGSVNVVIRVEDVNDNPPAFCGNVFFATVAENSPCGTTVFKVNATDNDSGIHAEINYAIEDGHPEVFFINPQSGIITLQEILNFESHQFYEVTVRAFNTHDNDQFSLAKVYVNVTGENEYIPQFAKTQYNFSVSENALKGTIVGCVTATDQDLGFDGMVNYLLIGESKERGFQINGKTGEVDVSGNMKLHGGSHILLRVLAKNPGRIRGFDVDEALINITILDDNDAPVFKLAVYQTHVREDALVGTSVITLMTDDSGTIPEWNQFVIKIKDGNKNNSFSINSQTGEIFVASSLDRETIPFYNLTIIAIDIGASPATVSTQLMIIVDDVNDNGPILVNTEGYVMENQPPGTQFISLNAIDLDLAPNQGPFRYQLADDNASSFVTLSPAGVLSTKKRIDRELISELYLPVIVHDSGIPPMSSMSIFHVVVLDQNDNPPLPRNLYIQVNYYGKYFPGGKLGSVKPEDPDMSGIFNCSIVTNSTTGFTIGSDTCELLSGKQLGEDDFNLTVKANDHVHSAVSSSIHIKYRHFNNATIDNSVLLLIAHSIKEFLDKKYLHFIEAIDDLLSKNNTNLYVFGMMPMSNQVLLMAAIKNNNGQDLSRSIVIDFFTAHKEWLRTHIGITISAVDYDPCATSPCHHGAVCTKQTGVSLDTVILESSSVIFLSHILKGPFNCICPNGYIGQLCEMDIDECLAVPCSNYGTCLNYPGRFSCYCPEGKLCQTAINYCVMSPCLNHGTCVNLPNGYSCRCPFGTSGNECDITSLGFEELSYMELPSLDPRNNMIYVEFTTIKENSLLLYNYDNKEGAEGEFLALEIVNGKVEFSYNLGNGIVRLVTDQQVADGQFHKISATRMGKSQDVDSCHQEAISGFNCKQNKKPKRDEYQWMGKQWYLSYGEVSRKRNVLYPHKRQGATPENTEKTMQVTLRTWMQCGKKFNDLTQVVKCDTGHKWDAGMAGDKGNAGASSPEGEIAMSSATEGSDKDFDSAAYRRRLMVEAQAEIVQDQTAGIMAANIKEACRVSRQSSNLSPKTLLGDDGTQLKHQCTSLSALIGAIDPLKAPSSPAAFSWGSSILSFLSQVPRGAISTRTELTGRHSPGGSSWKGAAAATKALSRPEKTAGLQVTHDIPADVGVPVSEQLDWSQAAVQDAPCPVMTGSHPLGTQGLESPGCLRASCTSTVVSSDVVPAGAGLTGGGAEKPVRWGPKKSATYLCRVNEIVRPLAALDPVTVGDPTAAYLLCNLHPGFLAPYSHTDGLTKMASSVTSITSHSSIGQSRGQPAISGSKPSRIYDHRWCPNYTSAPPGLTKIIGELKSSTTLGFHFCGLSCNPAKLMGHKCLMTLDVGSLTVDNCTNDQPAQFCFVSTPGIGTERTLDLDKNNMVFGGIKSIDPILLRPDQVKTHDFIGCIKEFKLNSVPVKFAEALSSSNILISCPRLDRVCQDKTCLNNGVCLDRWSFYLCQCPEGFSGAHCEKVISPDTAINLNGQFHLDYFIKESYKREQLLKSHIKRKRNQKGDRGASSFEIQFRTRSSEGILLHIQGNINYTTIKIMDGRINYISDAGSIDYIKHHLPDISVSDGKWHTFKMESNDFVTRLILDKKHLKNISHPTQKVGGFEVSSLSLGQAPVSQFDNLIEPGFKGCIKAFKYNNQVMPFTGSNDLVEVQPSDVSIQVGCRESNACLSNPCPTGMKCIDLWFAYECLPVSCFPDPCKHGGKCLPSSNGSYHCICKPDFTGSYCEFCTSATNDHSACQEDNIQFPQWSITMIIPVTLVVISLIVVFFKCRYTTLKNKRTKMVASLQTGTENKAFDDHDDDVDGTNHCTPDNDEKQPDILKAEKNYHIMDETYINATAIVQNKKCYGCEDYDLEVYDIDNASSISPSDIDVIQYHRQFQTNNDHYTILSKSMHDKSQPFIPIVNQRNTQSTAQISPSQQNAQCKKPEAKSGLEKQYCPHTCSSEWFPSSILFTEHKYLINDLYSTGYETELSHLVHFDTNQSSEGGIDNLTFCEDDRTGRLADASVFMSSSRPNSRIKQIVERLPLGLSVEEIKQLNTPTIQKSVKNTAQGILLSQVSQRTSAQKGPPIFLSSTDTSSDSDSHSSFTCSEYNYERELSAFSHSSVHKYTQQDSERNVVEDKILNEWEIRLQGHEKGYTSNSCLMNTEIITDEDSDNNMLPCDYSLVKRTQNWDDILNWGPNFEIYVEIFKDLAELPSEPETENQFCSARGTDHEEFL
ncbi:protocadherin Fat 4-like [Heterodontus francisci]|uniref:protocadherin Fat 4-like n=1 Tax=Heterodontus francisci TaxID=7792 RepID=UPI00355BAD21